MNKKIREVMVAMSKFRSPVPGVPLMPYKYIAAHLSLPLKLVAQQPDESISFINTRLKRMESDLWAIAVIIDRLEWLRQKADEDETLRALWPYYAAVDAEHFHTRFCAVMDHVAEIICENQKVTFAYLIKNRPPSIGKRLSGYIDEAWIWYEPFKENRRSLVHQGSNAVMQIQGDRIIFRVNRPHSETDKYLPLDELIMCDKENAFFDWFVAFYFGRLIYFIDNFLRSLEAKLISAAFVDQDIGWFGFGRIWFWMEAFLEEASPIPSEPLS